MAAFLVFNKSVYFTVEENVGRSKDGTIGKNRRDDVMLIQWLLSRTMLPSDYLGAPIAADGAYGPMTDYWLSRFVIKNATQVGVRDNPDPIIESINAPLSNRSALMFLLNNDGRGFQESTYSLVLKGMPPTLRDLFAKKGPMGAAFSGSLPPIIK